VGAGNKASVAASDFIRYMGRHPIQLGLIDGSHKGLGGLFIILFNFLGMIFCIMVVGVVGF
jgi:hypothetical protein